MPLKLKILFVELALVENLVLSQVLFEELKRGVWPKTAIKCETTHLVDTFSLDFSVGGQLDGGGLESHRMPLAELLVLWEPRHFFYSRYFVV